MTNILLLFKKWFARKEPKSVNLQTGIRTELVATDSNVKRIEVYEVERIDPLGVILKKEQL